MKLVIIESPGKKDALQKYLGCDYEVVSSKGHVRDLPVKSLGIDMTHNYEPIYEITADKKQVVSMLKSKASKAESVLLAADPDREGEAIAWHIAECLGIDENETCRIEFNEISKNAVQEALKKPRQINKQLVDAQQARRILDRIVGYKVSPIICKKIQPKLSAGRVQSVCLKLVVDREKEINEFIPEEYWNIFANVKKDGNNLLFKISLNSKNGKKVKVTNKEDADKIISILNNNELIVDNIKKSKVKQHAPAPFTTSTMQQDALNKLGMSLKKTSSCAQQLYEGVELGKDGKIALITYIRTDSTRVSSQAQENAKNFIIEKYGKDFYPTKPNVYVTKKNAQDAHEAIRPISLDITPAYVKEFVQPDIYKLYKLIYERFLASQMSDAIYNNVVVDVKCDEYGLKATGKTLDFAGYTGVYKDYTENKEKDSEDNSKIPPLTEGEKLIAKEVKGEQKFTKPPQRFTEASLVKAMEEKGIGRPATYTPTITILFTRAYVEKEGKYIKPTQLGENVNKYLEQFFKSVFNVKFTAHMEERLDDIAEVGENWRDVIDSFWNSFKDLLRRADESSVYIKTQPQESDVVCEKCGSKMLIREGKFGKFLGCSNFPKCRNIIDLNQDNDQEKGICPLCSKEVVAKKSKTGKLFYGCSGFPECNFMSWDLPTGDKCEKCSSHMIKNKKNEIKCSKCGWTK